jgi:hypothetical protein
MGYIGIVDPSLDLAQVIVGFTLFVCIFQLIIHGSKWIYSVYKRVFSNSKIAKETDDSLNSSNIEADVENITFFNYLRTSYLNSLLRFLLAIMYIRSITLVISRTHAVFEGNFNHYHYLANSIDVLTMQFAVICIASLLWYSAPYWIKKLVYWGLFIVSLDIVIEIMLQFLYPPFFHWIHLAELLLSGLGLLIIPTVGFLVFNYRFRLQQRE